MNFCAKQQPASSLAVTKQRLPRVKLEHSLKLEDEDVVVLKPRVKPINVGNLRTLVHDSKNILRVEEELVEIGGVVAPASRGNQASALRESLTRKKRVGWEIEALPYHNVGGNVPAFKEYEVAVVLQM
ncbi:hypothetical protein VNO80_03393 [Phaseolus coccineus]|uniref:Uncharacterized protein n=1 Tax=Phaseolus coccineus TaxID=3886 RepID=A0AAN9RRP5_PHACN